MKKILAALIAATMVLGLCACGSSSAPSAPAADTAAKSEAAAPAADAAADDTVYTFNIDYPNPESSVGFRALTAWAEYLREESNGRLDMQLYSGGALGALPDCVSNCESGVTDGFWSGVTIYPGVFPLTEVFGLPMIGAKNYQVINDALNEMLATYEPMAAEWSNFKVVTLHSSSISPILFAKGKNVKNIKDMAGLNLRISNAYSTEWFTQLGANPTSCGINDGYENIQKGVIDGGLFFYDKVESSALYEVIDALYHGMTIYPLNMLCLNIDKYNELPDDLKALIDDSGKIFLESSIVGFDEQEAAMLELCANDYDVNVIYEDEESIAWLTENAKTSQELWVKTMNDNGLDGQACFDKAVELIEKYNANY